MNSSDTTMFLRAARNLSDARKQRKDNKEARDFDPVERLVEYAKAKESNPGKPRGQGDNGKVDKNANDSSSDNSSEAKGKKDKKAAKKAKKQEKKKDKKSSSQSSSKENSAMSKKKSTLEQLRASANPTAVAVVDRIREESERAYDLASDKADKAGKKLNKARAKAEK